MHIVLTCLWSLKAFQQQQKSIHEIHKVRICWEEKTRDGSFYLWGTLHMFTDFRIWIKIKILSQIEFFARYVTACVCTSLFCIFFHFLTLHWKYWVLHSIGNFQLTQLYDPANYYYIHNLVFISSGKYSSNCLTSIVLEFRKYNSSLIIIPSSSRKMAWSKWIHNEVSYS